MQRGNGASVLGSLGSEPSVLQLGGLCSCFVVVVFVLCVGFYLYLIVLSYKFIVLIVLLYLFIVLIVLK